MSEERERNLKRGRAAKIIREGDEAEKKRQEIETNC